jgi:hypothetical protein
MAGPRASQPVAKLADRVRVDGIVLGALGVLALGVVALLPAPLALPPVLAVLAGLLVLASGVPPVALAGLAAAGAVVLLALQGLDLRDGRGQFLGALVAASLALSAAAFGWYARRYELRLTAAEAILIEVQLKRANMRGAFTAAQRELYRALLAGERHPRGEAESPFTPIDEPGDRVFDAYVRELSLFPPGVVDPLVRFYDRERAAEAFLRQANGEVFRAMRAERQLQLWQGFFGSLADHDAAAEAAERILAAYVADIGTSRLRWIVWDRRREGSVRP